MRSSLTSYRINLEVPLTFFNLLFQLFCFFYTLFCAIFYSYGATTPTTLTGKPIEINDKRTSKRALDGYYPNNLQLDEFSGLSSLSKYHSPSPWSL